MNTAALKALADQCICHPASRGIADIEAAGEGLKHLIAQLEQMTADRDSWAQQASAQPAQQEHQPMTDEEVSEKCLEWHDEGVRIDTVDAYKAGVISAERHHGIRKDCPMSESIVGTTPANHSHG